MILIYEGNEYKVEPKTIVYIYDYDFQEMIATTAESVTEENKIVSIDEKYQLQKDSSRSDSP